MTRRVKVGDIVEITSLHGTAHAQFTHKHPTFGHLLRVFARSPRSSAPVELLAPEPSQFLTFFPLRAAIGRGLAKIVGHAEVPPQSRVFPLFRAAMRDPVSGRAEGWWLWDGEREWPVGQLSKDQRALPIREILNDTLLLSES